MSTWWVGLALAGGSAPELEVPLPVEAPPAVVPVEPERIPGLSVARAGLVSGYVGAPVAGAGVPVLMIGLFGGSDPAAVVGGTALFGGTAATISGPIMASFGQKRALDYLDGEGVHVSRVPKRVGDGMFLGGAATVGVSTVLLYAQASEVGLGGLIVGGASMVLSLIPYEIQQGMIVRGARGPRPVSVSVTPAGISGRF